MLCYACRTLLLPGCLPPTDTVATPREPAPHSWQGRFSYSLSLSSYLIIRLQVSEECVSLFTDPFPLTRLSQI